VADQNAFTSATNSTKPLAATPTPLGRWTWITGSRKARIALGSIAMILLARILPKLGFSSGDVTELTASIAVIGGIWMHSIAIEDSAQAAKPEPRVDETDAEKNDLTGAK
jgi:hypothetical protein